MNNDVKFEHMEPVVDAICKSLEENHEDWRRCHLYKGDDIIQCVRGRFKGYYLMGAYGKGLLMVVKKGYSVCDRPFNKEQCDRIRKARNAGLDKVSNEEKQKLRSDLINQIKPERVKLKDAHLYDKTEERLTDNDHQLRGQKPSCFPPSAVFLVLIGIAIIGLTL